MLRSGGSSQSLRKVQWWSSNLPPSIGLHMNKCRMYLLGHGFIAITDHVLNGSNLNAINNQRITAKLNNASAITCVRFAQSPEKPKLVSYTPIPAYVLMCFMYPLWELNFKSESKSWRKRDFICCTRIIASVVSISS